MRETEKEGRGRKDRRRGREGERVLVTAIKFTERGGKFRENDGMKN